MHHNMCAKAAGTDVCNVMGDCALQSKVDKLSEALRSSQKQAKQADAEAQEMEKAFRVLQTEVMPLSPPCLWTQHARHTILWLQDTDLMQWVAASPCATLLFVHADADTPCIVSFPPARRIHKKAAEFQS